MTGENLKYLLGILNSKLSEWYFHLIGTTTGMGTNRWKKYKIELFPIANATAKAKKAIEEKVDFVLTAKQLGVAGARRSYVQVLTANYPPKKPLSSKLTTKLWDMEFVDVLAELAKSEITIPAKKQKEWIDLFLEERTKARTLHTQIAQAEQDIDRLVYALYGLTEEEVKVVERGVK